MVRLRQKLCPYSLTGGGGGQIRDVNETENEMKY